MQMQMSKKLSEYKAVIFDIDGTLYFQPPLRRRMAFKLGSYYLLHPWKIKDLFVIKEFRKIREEWNSIIRVTKQDIEQDIEDSQYDYVASRMNTTKENVKRLVYYWMYDFPLPYLNKCKDRELIRLIEKLNEDGITTAVYSDYPVEKKLEAMNIRVNHHFSALDSDMMCLKPDPKGMKVVLEKLNFMPNEVLMVGDRYSKDGKSAISGKVDYVILPKTSGKRKEIIEYLKRGY